MNDFEKALENLARPDIQVPRFKQQLHRDLRRSVRSRETVLYKRLFAACACVAAIFALALISVIAEPDYAQQAHVAFTGGSTPQIVPDESGTQIVSPDKLAELRRLIQNDLVPPENDHAMLEAAFGKQTLQRPIRVKNVQDQIYTVRRYQLADGRQAVVYTELDPAPETSY